MFFNGLSRHTKHLGLHRGVVGNGCPLEHLRTAWYQGDDMGNIATRATLRRGERHTFLNKQVENGALDRLVLHGEDVLRNQISQLFDFVIQRPVKQLSILMSTAQAQTHHAVLR